MSGVHQVAAPTGNDQVDEIVGEFALSADELQQLLAAGRLSHASMVSVAQGIAGRRDPGVVIRWEDE